MDTEKSQTEPGILKVLAHLLGTGVKNRRLDIPPAYGTGYCSGFIFNEQIRMVIMDYELKENLSVENPDWNDAMRMILFKFQNVLPQAGSTSEMAFLQGAGSFPEVASPSKDQQLKRLPSVLITTSSVNTDVMIPVHSNTSTINIEIDANYLKGLFGESEKSVVLQSLLQNTKPLLFEQAIFPSLQRIVNEIVTESIDKTFELFFMKVKAEELICRLLMELEKRDEKRLYPLNSDDIQTIYKVRTQMLEHLERTPVIKDLAVLAAMSPSKLKRLFKQVFGNSIFNYYQEFRMKEAASLLSTKKLSVSAVGYQLGFTNLSHFSRIFNEHIGMKPKQYSKSLN
ncbi:transcriptional regulator [Pedobacter sp. BAL39]|uniref:helix-turn-helix domain-containing protein n=1 Tax=Pedobacter sp. BAL39 TaxID=391596 RepID=UPI0001559B66|nr:AraC family transcriptional regulator [Pedobacter sp. BAL39]EDM38651.1 transcriptional regulator [Pedobacter sp. BAL39]